MFHGHFNFSPSGTLLTLWAVTPGSMQVATELQLGAAVGSVKGELQSPVSLESAMSLEVPVGATALGGVVSCLLRRTCLNPPARQCCCALPHDTRSLEPGSLALQAPFQLRDLGTSKPVPSLGNGP